MSFAPSGGPEWEPSDRPTDREAFMPRLPDRDDVLVAALRRGDADAFAALLDRHTSAMIRVAMAYVPSRAAAEEAVQETWIAVMRGIDGFEGRSSLKTWIFRILTNLALRSGARERRSTPFSALAEAEDTDEPAVDPARFLPADRDRFPGHWAILPTRWPTPEEGLLAGETREVIARAVADLPVAQRTVIGLRDIEGWSSEEVSEALEISPGNQRVLLHRARSRVRTAIEAYYDAVVTAESLADTPRQDSP
jgi:RNA polymerase sigma-70 factor, ECF subfamily